MVQTNTRAETIARSLGCHLPHPKGNARFAADLMDTTKVHQPEPTTWTGNELGEVLPRTTLAACGHPADGPEGDPECNACFRASCDRLGKVIDAIDGSRRDIELREANRSRGSIRAVPFRAVAARVQIDGERDYDPCRAELVARSELDQHNERHVRVVHLDAVPEALEVLRDTCDVMEAALACCTDPRIKASLADQIKANHRILGIAVH